jgi:transketolase
MNDTYVAYGRAGRARKELQVAQDENAAAVAPGAGCERAITKSGGAYKNESWDLVDACESEEVELEKMKEEELPEELQKLAPEERKAFLEKKLADRKAIQEQIQKLAKERDAFVTAAQKQQAESGAQTFDSAVGDILNKQLEKKGYEVVK